MKTVLIIIGIALLLVGGFFVNRHFAKKKLVDQIMKKYGDSKSPDYSANFDASPSVLIKKDIATLKGILAGTIK